MSRCQHPQHQRAVAEYTWAVRLWRRRTDCRLVTIGGLFGPTVLSMFMLAVAVGVHPRGT